MSTNYATGHAAEQVAAEYLKQRGFKVLEINWRTTSCEIDIIARKKDIIYLVEVKSRKNEKHGTGFAYITPKKLHQMKFAAEMWVASNQWSGDYQLAAVEMSPDQPPNFLDTIITS